MTDIDQREHVEVMRRRVMKEIQCYSGWSMTVCWYILDNHMNRLTGMPKPVKAAMEKLRLVVDVEEDENT